MLVFTISLFTYSLEYFNGNEKKEIIKIKMIYGHRSVKQQRDEMNLLF